MLIVLVFVIYFNFCFFLIIYKISSCTESGNEFICIIKKFYFYCEKLLIHFKLFQTFDPLFNF